MRWLKTFVKILLTGSVMLACGACSLLGLAMSSPLIAEGMAAKMLPPMTPSFDKLRMMASNPALRCKQL
jgi:hypothetical protein